MPDSKVILIVATSTKPETEDRYNKWYNDVHIPMLLKYDGLKKASRYKISGDNKEQAKYLAFYEFDSEQAMAAFNTSPEFGAAMEEMQGSWPEGGIDIVWMANYNLIKSWG